MIPAFWEAVGSKLADRLISTGIPAAIFWTGGLLCWLRSRGRIDALREPADWFDEQATATQVVLLIVLLFGIIGSGVLMNRLTAPLLRLVEGYWPAFLAPVHRRMAGRFVTQANRAQSAIQQLAELVMAGTASAAQRASFVQLDAILRQLPSDGRYQPTQTGNILRTAESRPVDKYGLDTVALWPHFWLLFPEDTRKEIVTSRAALDTAVGALGWGTAFALFTPWTWWAIPVGVVTVALAACVWVPERARVFAVLVEAAVDLHRSDIYRQLRWPLPRTPAEEREEGRRLTTYLVRGLDGDAPTFVTDEGDRDDRVR